MSSRFFRGKKISFFFRKNLFFVTFIENLCSRFLLTSLLLNGFFFTFMPLTVAFLLPFLFFIRLTASLKKDLTLSFFI